MDQGCYSVRRFIPSALSGNAFPRFAEGAECERTADLGQTRTVQADRGEHFDPEVVDAFLRIAPDDWTRIRRDIEQKESGSGRPESTTVKERMVR